GDAATTAVAFAAPQLQRDAGDVVTALVQQRGRDRGVDTAAHHHHDTRHQVTRSLATTSGTTASAASMSAYVDAYPRENRTDESARSRGIPIASKTCDGSTAPELHAEPEAAITPCWSSARSSVSASTPSNVQCRMPATRDADAPFTANPETWAASPRSSWSRNAAIRAISSARRLCVMRSAVANATIPATFCVPARNPRSWPPPSTSGTSWVPSRTINAPTPFGPPNLWPDIATNETSAVAAGRSSHCGACTASVCTTARGAISRTRRATSLMGWRTPVSLLTSITDTT